jgi:hypothetical protein
MRSTGSSELQGGSLAVKEVAVSTIFTVGCVVALVLCAVFAALAVRRLLARLVRAEASIERLGSTCTCSTPPGDRLHGLHSEGCPTAIRRELASLTKDRDFLAARLRRVGAIPDEGPLLFHRCRIERVMNHGFAQHRVNGVATSPIRTFCEFCKALPGDPGERCIFNEGEEGYTWEDPGPVDPEPVAPLESFMDTEEEGVHCLVPPNLGGMHAAIAARLANGHRGG